MDAEQLRLAEGGVKLLMLRANSTRRLQLPLNRHLVHRRYHQDYYLTSPLKYKYYRYRSGRDQFIEAMWAGDNTVYQSTQYIEQ